MPRALAGLSGRSAIVAAVHPVHAVRFLLELALLAALAVAGAARAWWLALLLPLAAVVLWGRFVAPKAPARLQDPARLLVELTLFLAAGVALALAGHPAAGMALTVSSVAVAVAVRRAGAG